MYSSPNSQTERNAMDDLRPHSCSHCREIVIDGSVQYRNGLQSPTDTPKYIYTFDSVAANAETCDFFKWAQNIPVDSSMGVFTITFDRSCDYITAEWRDSYDYVTSRSGWRIGRARLYMFAEEGNMSQLRPPPR